MWSQDGLELPQQRGFSAAGGPGHHRKIARMQREGHLPQDRLLLLRVGKGQILDRSEFHLQSSVRSMIKGIRQMPEKLR